MRGSCGGQSSNGESQHYKDDINPFHIPSDYTWVDANEKKQRLKAKKAKSKKNRKHMGGKGGNRDRGGNQMIEDLED